MVLLERELLLVFYVFDKLVLVFYAFDQLLCTDSADARNTPPVRNVRTVGVLKKRV